MRGRNASHNHGADRGPVILRRLTGRQCTAQSVVVVVVVRQEPVNETVGARPDLDSSTWTHLQLQLKSLDLNLT